MRSLLVLLALVACKRDDPGGNGAFGALPDAQVTILDEGSGPEVDGALLQPTGAGYRAALRWDWVQSTGAIDAGRDDVLAEESGRNPPGASWYGRSAGLYRSTDEGLVLQALDRPLDDTSRPALVMPNVVRVGLYWESDLGDGTFNRRKVVARMSTMLPTGPAEQWGIVEEYPDGGQKVTRWYAEGVGYVGQSGGYEAWDPRYGFDEMVVPVTPQEHVELGLDPAPLTSLLPLPGQQEIWGISGAVFDGVLWAYLDGEDAADGWTRAWPHDWCARLDDSPKLVDVLWNTAIDPQCPVYTWNKPDEFGAGFTPVQEIANAGRVLPGLTTLLPLDAAGAVGPAAGSSMPVTLSGWVVDGVAHTLIYAGNPPAQFYRSVPDPVVSDVTALTDGTATRAVFLNGREDALMSVGYDWSALVGLTWIGPAVMTSDATVHFAVLGLDGRVFRVTLNGDTLSGFVPVGVLPGTVSILLDGDERIGNSITPDGRVFQARVDQTNGDVSIVGLGSVRVEEPGDIYEFKGVLVDPNHPGDVYVAAFAMSATLGNIEQTGLFKAHLDQTPLTLQTAASISVGAAEIDAGIAVCWAPSDEAFSGDGWTLRGEPVEVVGPVGPDGNCAIVPFDRTAPADPNWLGSDRAIEAVIPGVGQVRLGFPAGRHVGYTLFPLVAARPDGSIVDITGLILDRHGFPISKTTTDVGSGIRDLGGNGFWISSGNPSQLRNLGGGGAVGPTCSVPGCSYWGGVIGGGALYYTPRQGSDPLKLQVIHVDGSIEDVPAAQAAVAGTIGPSLLLADGRICGRAGYPYRIDCVDPAGVTESTGLIGTLGGDWWPLSDGSLMLAGEGTLRFDPANMTFSTLDARRITGAITSADGHVYAIAYVSGETATLVEITPDAVIDLATVRPSSSVVPIDGALLVTASQDGQHLVGWTRIPR